MSSHLSVATLTYPMTIAATIMVTGSAHGRPSNCPTSPRADGEIEQTINAFFDALQTEDRAAFQRLTTKTFYSFDGGKRYPGNSLVDVVREAHAKGVQLNW